MSVPPVKQIIRRIKLMQRKREFSWELKFHLQVLIYWIFYISGKYFSGVLKGPPCYLAGSGETKEKSCGTQSGKEDYFLQVNYTRELDRSWWWWRALKAIKEDEWCSPEI
jgi:hypothetical protein